MTVVIFKEKEEAPVVKMIVPGRRALGEDWREVTIAVKDDRVQVTGNEAAERPAEGKPIVLPALSKLSNEEVNFLMEGAAKTQEYWSRQNKRPSQKEVNEAATRMWNEYVEQKLAWFKGKTTVGAGGFFQREKPGVTHWSKA